MRHRSSILGVLVALGVAATQAARRRFRFGPLDRLLRASERNGFRAAVPHPGDRRGHPADNEGQAGGDSPGLLTQRKSDCVRAAGLRDLHRETGRERPAQADLRRPRQLPRLVAGRQAHRFRPAVPRPSGASTSCPRRGPSLLRLSQAPPSGRPTWTADGKGILIPAAGDLVRVDSRSGKVLKYYGLSLDIQNSTDRDAVAESPDDRVRRTPHQHRPERLRGGPVPSVRPLSGQRPEATSPTAHRQRHRPRGLVPGWEDPGLRLQEALTLWNVAGKQRTAISTGTHVATGDASPAWQPR